MADKKKYCGVVVPMITPLDASLKIDPQAVKGIIDHLTGSHTHPFVSGTTGESSSISYVERKKLVKATVDATAGRATVYVGIAGNCLEESIKAAQEYHGLGADVLVAHLPCYYPLEPDQMLEYFEILAEAVPAPLIIYNIPVTTGMSIPLEIVDQLSRHPHIIGLKDSERGMDRLESAISRWKDRNDFSYLLGWAAMSQKALQLGADGIVPSSGNLVPYLYHTIVEAVENGNEKVAAMAQEKTDRISAFYQEGRILSKALPMLKAIMSAYDLCKPYTLPPMQMLSARVQKSLAKTFTEEFGDLDQINSIEE